MYEIGALAALDDFFSAPQSGPRAEGRGFSVNDFDVYVGTSAGAFLATVLASGIRARRLFRAALDDDPNFFPARRTDIYRFDLRQGLGILRDVGGVLLSAAARAVRRNLDLGRAGHRLRRRAAGGHLLPAPLRALPRALLAPSRAADALRRGAARAVHHRQRSRLGASRHLRAGRARRHSHRQGDLRLVGDPALLRAGALQRARLHRRRRRQGGARRHRAGAPRRPHRRRQSAGAGAQRSRSRRAADAARRRAPSARQGHARGLGAGGQDVDAHQAALGHPPLSGVASARRDPARRAARRGVRHLPVQPDGLHVAAAHPALRLRIDGAPAHRRARALGGGVRAARRARRRRAGCRRRGS